jgi:hypothetical protein
LPNLFVCAFIANAARLYGLDRRLEKARRMLSEHDDPSPKSGSRS